VAQSGTDFRKLYESHAPHVRRFVLFLGGDQALADDITSETFVRAWTAPGPIRQETARAYLFTIARNLFRDARRRASRQSPLDIDLSDDGVSAQQRVEDRSELRRVLAEAQRLPEIDRAALLMRAQDQMSYEAIAQALGLSIASAKVKIHRARLKLMRATRGDVALVRSETP
jgi:RNA polymerase sigma-70 factor (ECF subfamily)